MRSGNGVREMQAPSGAPSRDPRQCNAWEVEVQPTDRPDLGYAMIFPGMTIVKILFVDSVPVFFSG
jgi:hypothetical protein